MKVCLDRLFLAHYSKNNFSNLDRVYLVAWANPTWIGMWRLITNTPFLFISIEFILWTQWLFYCHQSQKKCFNNNHVIFFSIQSSKRLILPKRIFLWLAKYRESRSKQLVVWIFKLELRSGSRKSWRLCWNVTSLISSFDLLLLFSSIFHFASYPEITVWCILK